MPRLVRRRWPTSSQTARKECRRSTALASRTATLPGSGSSRTSSSTGRPDSARVRVRSRWGLGRSRRDRGRIDLLTATLPRSRAMDRSPPCSGAPAGAFLGDLIARRAVSARILLCWVAIVGGHHRDPCGVPLAGTCSGTRSASIAQPLSLATWLENVPSSAPFFFPLIAVAGSTAWRRRNEPASPDLSSGPSSWRRRGSSERLREDRRRRELLDGAIDRRGGAPRPVRSAPTPSERAVSWPPSSPKVCVIYADVAEIDWIVLEPSHRYRRRSRVPGDGPGALRRRPRRCGRFRRLRHRARARRPCPRTRVPDDVPRARGEVHRRRVARRSASSPRAKLRAHVRPARCVAADFRASLRPGSCPSRARARWCTFAGAPERSYVRARARARARARLSRDVYAGDDGRERERRETRGRLSPLVVHVTSIHVSRPRSGAYHVLEPWTLRESASEYRE